MRHIYQSGAGDGRGNVIPQMTVSCFLADTTTAANVYAAETGGSPVNAVLTAEDGSFLFFVDDADYSLNQRFKITLTRDGYITKSYNDIAVFAPVPSNTYYPDCNAADQGDTINTWSVKSIINRVGSDNATIILRNNSGSINTSYTVATALTIPSNIEIKPEIGGMFVKSGSGTLTINGPIVGNPMHQWLSGFSPGDVTLPRSVPARPEFWGAKGDSSTDDTVAINCAWRSNNTLRLADKEYMNTGIEIETATVGDRTKDNISIIGEGRHKSFLTLIAGSSNTYALKLQGLVATTPQGFNETINDIYLSNFCANGKEYAGAGIDINGGYRVELNNMYSTGNKYGIKMRNCINVKFSGVTELTGNKVAIKVPTVEVSGSATIDTYNFGANVVDIGLLDVRSNLYASLSIGLGQTWTIGTILAENTPVTMYMMEQCNGFTINNLYLENNATPVSGNHAVKSQFGDYRFWAVFQGQDEDGNVSTVGLNRNITIHNIYDTNNHLLHLYGMEQLEARYLIGAGGYETAGDCSYIDVTGGNYKETNTIIPGVGRTVAKRVGLRSGHNLVANGSNYFPNKHANDSSGTVTRVQKTMNDGGNTNVTQLTLAIGAASVEHKIYLPRAMYGDYTDRAALKLLAEVHVKASASTVTNIKIKLISQAGATLSGSGEVSITDYTNPTKTRTNWNTITCNGTTVLTDTPNGSYLVITATRTDTTGTDYLWIADIIVRDAWIEYITSPSIFDVLAGYCFRGITSVSDAGRFYVEFTLPNDLYYATYYEVIATAYGTANEGVSVVKANGSFRVYTTSTGINVVAQLIPLQAISA